MPRICFLRRTALLAALLCGAMASASAQQVFDNWNSAACGTTDVATLTVERPIRLQRVDIWYHWRPNETTAHFTASFGGEVIEEGELSRAECDPNQAAWCVARLEAGAEIEPGIYTFRTARAAICQNRASGGNGFIRAFGASVTAPASGNAQQIIQVAREAPDRKLFSTRCARRSKARSASKSFLWSTG